MAQRLDAFDFEPDRPRGRPPRYPWRDWTDGSIWQVVRGVDYAVTSRSLQATLYAYAGRQQLGLQTRRLTVDGHEALIFRFFDRTPQREPGRVDAGPSWR